MHGCAKKRSGQAGEILLYSLLRSLKAARLKLFCLILPLVVYCASLRHHADTPANWQSVFANECSHSSITLLGDIGSWKLIASGGNSERQVNDRHFSIVCCFAIPSYIDYLHLAFTIYVWKGVSIDLVDLFIHSYIPLTSDWATQVVVVK
jgi:hypothetical protein